MNSTEVDVEVSCLATPQGNLYRFYRNSADFPRAFRPVVPFLLGGHADVLLGPDDADPRRLLRVGPIRGVAEAELLRLIGRYLVTRCEPV